MKQNIVFFGGSGLIGSEIIQKFEKNKKYNVINVDIHTKNKSNFYRGNVVARNLFQMF